MLQALTRRLLALLLCPLVASCTTDAPEFASLSDRDYAPVASPYRPGYAHGYWRDPSWDGPPVAVLRPAPPPPPAAKAQARPPDNAPPPRASERRAAPYAQAAPPASPVFRSGPTNGIVVVPRPDAKPGERTNRPVVSGGVTAPSGTHPPPSVKAAQQGKASPDRKK